MPQFELDFVDLNPGYPFFYLTASTKNSVPFDDSDKDLIPNLIGPISGHLFGFKA